MSDDLSNLIEIIKGMNLAELVWLMSVMNFLDCEQSEEGCE